MVNVTDETKKRLMQFVDSEGKIMIIDSMPEDLKSAIRYLNQNNISLFTEIEDVVDEGEEETETEFLDESEDIEDESSENSFTDSSSNNNVNVILEDDTVSDEELDNMF